MDARPRFDLIVVGGGPAGCAAAIAATRNQRSVALIEPGRVPRSASCPAWVGPLGARFCREIGVDAAAAGAAEFPGLRLWPWDLRKPVEVRDSSLAGWCVQPEVLGAALLAAARRSGVEVIPSAANGVQLGEDDVTVALSDGPPIRGRVLIVADGANSRTARLAYLEPAHEVGWGAQTRLAAPGLERGLDVVLGVGRTIRVATLARNGHQACLTLMTGDGSAAAQLADLCKAAAAAGLLPSGSGAAVTAAPNLGGAALELESHVGKRCLLVGDAGGFVSAFSHEGLYPALRSGWLAAESAARSLDAPVLQDELATFSSLWRTNLADYLHAPNTDLALLLPMVFSNLRMAQRLAQAFLLGQAL